MGKDRDSKGAEAISPKEIGSVLLMIEIAYGHGRPCSWVPPVSQERTYASHETSLYAH